MNIAETPPEEGSSSGPISRRNSPGPCVMSILQKSRCQQSWGVLGNVHRSLRSLFLEHCRATHMPPSPTRSTQAT